MGSVWLNGSTAGYPSVVEVLTAAGVRVATYDGWEHRSRSTGGFGGSGMPNAVMGVVCHHTASQTSPANDLAYMVGADDGPVSNGLLDRTGVFTVIGAGATNHAGKGGGSSGGGGAPWHTSRGQVLPDRANEVCFGIEAANNGVGEPWPEAQQDAYVAMVRALADAYGLDVTRDVRSHHEWTPPRKIDPRGPSRWQPADPNAPWDMNRFRADVLAGAPPEEGDPVGWLYRDTRYSNVFVRGQGPAAPVTTEELQAGGLAARLGAVVEAAHGGVLAAITAQAWGMTPDEATAAGYLVRA